MHLTTLAGLLATATLFGCGDSFSGEPTTPADVAGTYSLNITDTAQNGCRFDGWTEGKTTMNLPFTMTQDGASVSGQLTGVTASLFDLFLGSGAHAFDGEVDGDALSLVAHGSRSFQDANCSYTLDATVAATVTGATLQGTLDYTSRTNESPDCASLGYEGCVTEQAVTGARPQ